MIPHIEKIGALRKMLHERDAIAQTIAILEELGDIDAQIEQARQRLAAVREEEVAARNRSQQALVDLDDVRNAIEAAKVSASEILAKAKEDGAVILADGQRQANAVRAEADADRVAAAAVLQKAKRDAEEIEAQLSLKRAELAELEGKIAQAKAAARAAFGT